MASDPTDPSPARTPGARRARIAAAARSARAHLRDDLARARTLAGGAAPPSAEPPRGVLAGAALPLAVLRAGATSPGLRRAHLRIFAARAAIVLAATGSLAACELALPESDLTVRPAEVAAAKDPARPDDVRVSIAGIEVKTTHREGTPPGLHVERWRGFELAAKLYGFAIFVEWCVIALTRSYDDQLARRYALAVGAPPEDDEASPRVRLDVRWLRKKARQKVRGVLVFAAFAPLLVLVRAVPAVGDGLAVGLTAAWAIYWAGVFACAKASFAWSSDDARPPLCVRVVGESLGRVPGFRWVERFYLRVLHDFAHPARTFERAPGALLGLAVFRALTHPPVLNLFVRPLVPVSVAASLGLRSPDPTGAGAPSPPPPEPTSPDRARSSPRG